MIPTPERPVTRAWLFRPSLVLLVALSMLAVMVTAADANPSSDEARAMLQRAQERLDQLEGEFNGVVDDYNEAVERLEHAEERVAEAEAELARLRTENDALRTAAANHVRQLHKYGPTIEMTTVLGSPDPSAASNTAAALRRVLLGQQADLQGLTATRTSLEAAEQRLLDEQEQAAEHAEAVEAQRARIEATLEEQADEVSHLEGVLASAIAREEAERRAREEAAARAAAEQRRQERLAQERARQQTQQTQQTQTPQAQPQQTSTTPAPAPRANAQVAVDAALSKLGSPYRWGATGPNAFDCSGLMVWAWAQAGVSLPRTSAGQFANLRRISRSELQPGDLVFAGSPRVHHVGMYIGNGQIVHSPRSGYTVSIRSMERSDLRGFARPG
jgi:peptidoglycan DL-endopeptidase CwlO